MKKKRRDCKEFPSHGKAQTKNGGVFAPLHPRRFIIICRPPLPPLAPHPLLQLATTTISVENPKIFLAGLANLHARVMREELGGGGSLVVG